MTQVGTTLTYTLALVLPNGTYEYKYFKNAGWDGGEYTGGSNRLASVSGNTTINDTWGGSINWANLQWPGTGSINNGDAYDVYAQAYIPNGITSPQVLPMDYRHGSVTAQPILTPIHGPTGYRLHSSDNQATTMSSRLI
ncbi:MAG: hypothetical protein IPH45_03530 [Bacteroidales bacterium]|nr:hypothetical protein [Bacteroidales bacterium]